MTDGLISSGNRIHVAISVTFSVFEPMLHFSMTAATLMSGLFALLALALLVPISIFVIEVIAAVFGPLKKGAVSQSLPKTAILIPAHNESLVIRHTLQCLMTNLQGAEQVVVVADNCSDDTAAIARSFGVTVLERQDAVRRGKGYALDFGLGYLAADAPDVVVVIDADCLVQANAIHNIASMAMTSKRPVQACYLMEQPSTPTAKSAVSALAFLVKNWVRPVGVQRMGFPCLLTGTGMAFPWTALDNISLASGNIVEDMQLSVDLAIAGQAPLFCEDALVIGCLPQQTAAAVEQRKRWEHGHLQTSLSQIPRLLKVFVDKKRFNLLAMALDFSIPPLSLLILVWLALFSLVAAFTVMKMMTSQVLGVMAVEGGVMLLAVVASWLRFGRTQVPAKALLGIPFYILWKIPLYFAFLVKPQVEWVRTARDASPEV